jgi:hypothetical protein
MPDCHWTAFCLSSLLQNFENRLLVFLSSENRAVYEIMWRKYSIAGLATDDNMAHAHCMLDNYGYRHTLRICNTQFFSTATVVTRTSLSSVVPRFFLSSPLAFYIRFYPLFTLGYIIDTSSWILCGHQTPSTLWNCVSHTAPSVRFRHLVFVLSWPIEKADRTSPWALTCANIEENHAAPPRNTGSLYGCGLGDR